MLFQSHLLEFFHGMHVLGSEYRSHSSQAGICMKQTCKSHTGKALISIGIFQSVFSFSQGNFSTETFGLTNLATFFQLLGTSEMFFQVLLGFLTHDGQFFCQAQSKILGSHIHQHRILSHFKCGLLGSHIILGSTIGCSTLKASKQRPDGSQASVKEHIVLNLHAKVLGVLDLFGGSGAILFGLLDSSVISILARHNPAPDVPHLGIHCSLSLSLCCFFGHTGGNHLLYGTIIQFTILLFVGGIVSRNISLGISGGTCNIA